MSGPSGAGKGTLVRAVLERVPAVSLSISATTRNPRPGEIDGVHYHFLTDEQFQELIDADGLIEWAMVHEHRYGTPRAKVEETLASGVSVILEIDPQGAFQVKERMPDSILVFIMPPTFDDLRERLEGRGSETDEEIQVRLQTAVGELQFAGRYDFVVINDDVRQATDELAAIIECRDTTT